MEDVLEVYKLPYDPQRPLLCMDEMPKQLLADKQDPLPCQPGQPAKEDYGYQRKGVADLFMLFEPLQGKRFVEVTEKRRKLEWATVMKQVSDILYPQAEKIIVVLDNLNTHTPTAFYETFEPQEARRLLLCMLRVAAIFGGREVRFRHGLAELFQTGCHRKRGHQG